MTEWQMHLPHTTRRAKCRQEKLNWWDFGLMHELFSLYNTQECSGDADSTSAAAPAGAGAAVSRMGQLRAELGRGSAAPHISNPASRWQARAWSQKSCCMKPRPHRLCQSHS